ncbi:MAG: DUF4407 domain-containing protein [Bacteroidales bacterium]
MTDNKTLRFFCFITGENFNMLVQEAPPSQRKIMVMGMSVFFPALLWFFSTLLLTNQVLEINILWSLLAALAAGFLILNLERTIIMASRNGWITFIRLCLGATTAIIGSFAIDTVIFHDDINSQLNEMKTAAIHKAVNDLKSRLEKEEFELRKAMNLKEMEWRIALIAVTQEADGTGGSGKRGIHSITLLKLDNARKYEKEYNEAKGKVDDFNRKKEIQLAEAKNNAAKTYEKTGMLIRIKATHALLKSNIYAVVFYIIFFAFMLLIELMPVLLKYFLPETAYDFKLKMLEELSKRRLYHFIEPSLTLNSRPSSTKMLQNYKISN